MPSLRLALNALSAAVFAMPAMADQTNAPQADATAVKTEIIARGLANPWGLQFLPDGRYLVTEKPGRMRIVSKDGKISKPIAGVPEVSSQGQGGLLDVALAPDFADSGKLFFSFSEPRGDDKNGTSVARAKLVLDGNGGRLEDVKVIFQQQPSFKSSFHFGSRIVINPDGTLVRDDGRAQLPACGGAEPGKSPRQGHPHHSGRRAGVRQSEARWLGS